VILATPWQPQINPTNVAARPLLARRARPDRSLVAGDTGGWGPQQRGWPPAIGGWCVGGGGVWVVGGGVGGGMWLFVGWFGFGWFGGWGWFFLVFLVLWFGFLGCLWVVFFVLFLFCLFVWYLCVLVCFVWGFFIFCLFCGVFVVVCFCGRDLLVFCCGFFFFYFVFFFGSFLLFFDVLWFMLLVWLLFYFCFFFFLLYFFCLLFFCVFCCWGWFFFFFFFVVDVLLLFFFFWCVWGAIAAPTLGLGLATVTWANGTWARQELNVVPDGTAGLHGFRPFPPGSRHAPSRTPTPRRAPWSPPWTSTHYCIGSVMGPAPVSVWLCARSVQRVHRRGGPRPSAARCWPACGPFRAAPYVVVAAVGAGPNAEDVSGGSRTPRPGWSGLDGRGRAALRHWRAAVLHGLPLSSFPPGRSTARSIEARSRSRPGLTTGRRAPSHALPGRPPPRRVPTPLTDRKSDRGRPDSCARPPRAILAALGPRPRGVVLGWPGPRRPARGACPPGPSRCPDHHVRPFGGQ